MTLANFKWSSNTQSIRVSSSASLRNQLQQYPSGRWRKQHRSPVTPLIQHTRSWRYCRANDVESGEHSAAEEDSGSASQPTVTDEQRRIALRLPPKGVVRTPGDEVWARWPGGWDPDEDDDEDDGDYEFDGQDNEIYEQPDLLLSVCSETGLEGSVALLLAYALHLDAFGGIHWDSGDLLIGLALSSPFICIDALVMLGEWSRENAYRSPTVSKQELRAIADLDAAGLRKLGREIGAAEHRLDDILDWFGVYSRESIPQDDVTHAEAHEPMAAASDSAAAAANEDGGDDGSSREVEVVAEDPRAPWRAFDPEPAWIRALEEYQGERLTPIYGMTEAPLLQALVVTLRHLSGEMLFRAVGLAATAGWATDRLFEAGFDNVVEVAGRSVPTPTLGSFLAIAIGCSYSLALAVAALTGQGAEEVELFAEEWPFTTGEMYESEDGEALPDEDGGEAAAIRRGKALEFLRDATETAVLCAAYLATGNLLASYGASVAIDASFRVCRHLRSEEFIKTQTLLNKNSYGELVKHKGELQKINAAIAAVSASTAE